MITEPLVRPSFEQFQRYLDAFTALYIEETPKMPSEKTILELLLWVAKENERTES